MKRSRVYIRERERERKDAVRVKGAPKVGGQLAPTVEREDLLISHACA